MAREQTRITVLYFAALRDLVGLAEEEVFLQTGTESVRQLVDILLLRHPRLSLDGVRIAVNEEFSNEEAMLESGDVVALIPPVSGG